MEEKILNDSVMQESDKSQKLVDALDDMTVGEGIPEEYAKRYNNWAKAIRENAETMDELAKVIVVNNLIRSLPNEFDSVKELVLDTIEEHSFETLAWAIPAHPAWLKYEEYCQSSTREKEFKILIWNQRFPF